MVLLCPGSQEDKQESGVHKTERNQLAKREDDATLFGIGMTSP